MSWSFYDANGKILHGILGGAVDTTELADDAVTTAKILDDAVTAAKLANSINTEITANTAKTGITSGQASAITANTAKVTNATHTGDVTGATALTIATDAVEGSMVHANVVDDTTLEQNGTQFRIKDNGVTLAKMAHGTDGNLITYDTAGAPAYVATGTDGQVLTSAGANNPPVFESIVAGVSIQLVVALGI